MKIDKDIMFFVVTLVFLIGFFALNPVYTGFQVANASNTTTPEIEIFLSQDTFTQSQLIGGQVIVNLSGTIYSNDKIIATIGNVVSEKSLVDIVRNLNIPHKQIQQTVYSGNNPESSKIITFDSSGFKAVGIKIRKGANVESVDLSIKGLQHNNNYPTFPQLDFGAKGVYNDWEYFGGIDGYETQAITGGGLDENNPELTPSFSPNTNAYPFRFCEKVSLPRSKSFNLSVKYRNDASVGRLKLEILDLQDYGLDGDCDLSSSRDIGNSVWHSCIADFNFPISGVKLICLSVENTGARVFISQEEVSPSTGYRCPIEQDLPTYNCGTDSNDYYVKAYEGIYPKKLKTEEPLLAWETTASISKLSINNYLSNCAPYDNDNIFCMVPLKVISESAGKIELKDFKIDYKKSGFSYREEEIYNLDFTESAIELENATLVGIPLEVFLLFAPDQTNTTIRIETTTGLQAEAPFNIIRHGLITDPIPTTKSKIQSTKNILTNNQNDDVTVALGLQDDVTLAVNKLVTFESNLSLIETSTILTQVEKDSRATAINLQIDALTNNLPRSVSKKTVLKFKPSGIDYSTLSSEIPIQPGYEPAIYDIQNQINVGAEAQLVEVLYFSGNKKTVTVIKKTIKTQQPLTNIEIIERIPKTLAQSASEITFNIQPTVLRDDPIVKFVFPQISSQNPGIISYAVQGDLMSHVEETNLLYIPTDISKNLIGIDCGNNFCNYLEDYISCPEDCTCGNNVCDSGEDDNTCFQDCGKGFPIVITVTIVIIILLALYGVYFYMYIYRNPERYRAYMEKLRKIPLINFFIKEKKVFKSEQDKIRLKQFVSNALSKGFKKEQITSTLLNKGWTKEQIGEVFKNN